MNARAFIFDVKRLYREPILILFMCVPFLALTAIRLLATFGFPAIYRASGFDMTPYLGYVEAFSIILSPAMLGTVSAFLMIDEMDEGIYSLMSVTPLGFRGYMTSRIMMPFVLSVIYTFISHGILNLYSVSILRLTLAAFFSGIQGAILGLMLFSLADDKVKGLTYTKGLNSLMVTTAADLLGIRWLSIVSSLIPYYWTSYVITKPLTPQSLLLSLLVHLLWLTAAGVTASKRR